MDGGGVVGMIGISVLADVVVDPGEVLVFLVVDEVVVGDVLMGGYSSGTDNEDKDDRYDPGGVL